MYYVSKRARQDVTVAIMGQGPDELFGGYTRHLGVHYGNYWRNTPSWLRAALSAGIDRLPRSPALKRGVRSLAIEDPIRRYQEVFSIESEAVVDGLFRDQVLSPGAGDRILECWGDIVPLLGNADELGKFQALELRSSLPDELLMYGDKLSMAHGLEVRVPFLDREIVDYVESLPASFKVRYGQRKWLHRQVCHDFLPPEIVNRKKKAFASSVVDDWFKSSLDGKMNEYLLDDKSYMYEYLDPKAVVQLLQDHQSGRHDHHKLLFSIVVFEVWLRSFYLPYTSN